MAQLNSNFSIRGSIANFSSYNAENEPLVIQGEQSNGNYYRLAMNNTGAFLEQRAGDKLTTHWNIATKSDLTWKQLGAVDVSDSETHELSYGNISPAPREFLISYGTKNTTQSYGGAELLIPAGENKPSYLPIYSISGPNFAEVAVAFTYNATGQKKITFERKTSTHTLRFIVWYR